MGNDFRHQHVTPNNREIGRGVLRSRLLHETHYLHEPAVAAAGLQDSVALCVFPWHFRYGYDVAACLMIGVGELGHAGSVRHYQIIRKENSERVVSDEGAGAPDGMTKTEGHLL